MVEAWVTTRMDRDRTIITLSAAGIGLLITILTTVGPSDRWQLWLYAASALGFGVAILASLRVLERNSEAIEHAIGARSEPPKLVHLDHASRWGFAFGVTAFVAIAVLTALTTASHRETRQMLEPNDTSTSSGQTPLQKSLDGVTVLQPPAAQSPNTSAPQQQTGQPVSTPSASPPKE